MRSTNKMKFIGTALLMLAIFVSVSLVATTPRRAEALSSSDFQAGRIIDNAIFENSSTMSVQDIQNFLNAKVPSCDVNGALSYSYYYDSTNGRVSSASSDGNDTWVTTTRALFGQRYDAYYATDIAAGPLVCLKSYVENTTTNQNNLHGNTLTGGISAAQIIWNAAQTYSINPEVLIVTLQKEQGLVTDDWPWANQFEEAMGYMCPDTPQGCNSSYAGFYTQVTDAAWQFRHYLENNGSPGNYWVGSYFIPYNPDGSCSGTVVNIQNSATASLYDYTPYQPNPGALAGISNSSPGNTVTCGAYGNRNFWWYFNTWFGSSLYHGVPYAHPDGTLVRNQTELQVYLIENGQRLPVQTQESLFSYGYNFGDVKFANYYDDQLPVGSPLPLLKEGTIFKGSGPAIYVYRIVSGTPQKQHFPTWETFTGLGYTLSDVTTVPDWEIPAANFASDVSVTQHPVGALVQPAGSLQVYYVDPSGTRRSFPNQEVFYSYRYRFIQLKLATAADMQLPLGNPMAFKEGKLLQGSGPQIYVPNIQASDGSQQKSLITSWFCFVQMGYTYPPDVMRVQDWELNALPNQGPAC